MKAVRLLEYGGQLVFNDVPAPTFDLWQVPRPRFTGLNSADKDRAAGRNQPVHHLLLACTSVVNRRNMITGVPRLPTLNH
jgi:hypothetical protein